MMKEKLPELPKLPFGEGSYCYKENGRVFFRKPLKLENGDKIMLRVTGDNVRDCNLKMHHLEIETMLGIKRKNEMVMIDEIYNWFKNVKKPALKIQSYERLEQTIRLQIEPAPFSHYKVHMITTEDVQAYINYLNEVKRYSKSSIKKTYDCLNDFFRYISAKEDIKNPMLLVVMPIDANIKVETKEIKFFDSEDIKLFVQEAGARYNTGTLKYRAGYALAANIYMGLRGGELLALKWGDVDFKNKTVYICKTLIEKKNPLYDEKNPELMKKKDIHKICFEVQNSTKKSKNRYVPMNSKAEALLRLHYENSEFHDPEDFVINTRNRKSNTIKNISNTIKAIASEAETKERQCGSHVLRHTCASLYFRNGVPIETICQILGNSREVCEKTYVHFMEEQLKAAASKICAIELVD